MQTEKRTKVIFEMLMKRYNPLRKMQSALEGYGLILRCKQLITFYIKTVTKVWEFVKFCLFLCFVTAFYIFTGDNTSTNHLFLPIALREGHSIYNVRHLFEN